MENKLDQLFRNQLLKHDEIPSSKAWDQIHEKLKSTRRVLWAKRLAIAASVLLLATTGYFGFQSLTNMEESTTNTVSKPFTEENKINQPQKDVTEDVVVGDTKTNPRSVDIENSEKLVVEEIHHEDLNSKINEPDQEILKAKEDITLIAEVNMENNENGSDLKINEQMISYDSMIRNGEIEEPLIAEKVIYNMPSEVEVNEKSNTTYPKIEIIYKAGRGSNLLVSNDRSFIKKGLNKLTEFSDEHLLTADRRTKLRNTKEDLMALNFGKLLNKSNKVEN